MGLFTNLKSLGKRLDNPAEIVSVGEKIEVQVIKVAQEEEENLVEFEVEIC